MCLFAERLDLNIHAGRQIELHQRVDRLRRGLENIEQALVRANLELLARFLVHVRRTQHRVFVFHRGQRNGPRDLRPGTACRINNLTRGLVQDSVVVRFQPNSNSFFTIHVSLANPSRLARKERTGGMLQAALVVVPYCTISLIVPAPTVCPPSRIAKRKPFSMATGVISSITNCTLSPGITISVPAGNSATPVTSVVLK